MNTLPSSASSIQKKIGNTRRARWPGWHFSFLAVLTGCVIDDFLMDSGVGEMQGGSNTTCLAISRQCGVPIPESYTFTYDMTIGSSATIDLEEFLPAAIDAQGETFDVDFARLRVGGKYTSNYEWHNFTLQDNNTSLQLEIPLDYDHPSSHYNTGVYLSTGDSIEDHIYLIRLNVDVAPRWGADVQTHWAIPTSDSSYSLELPTPMDDGRSDVTYSLLNAPAGVSLTDTTLTGSATGVAITYVASDAFNTAIHTLTIEDNVAPDWATAEGNGSLTTTIEFGTGLFTTTLVAAEDANTGQALTYSVDGLPEEWLFHATTRELIGTFDAVPLLRTFDYTVSDGEFEDITTVTLEFATLTGEESNTSFADHLFAYDA